MELIQYFAINKRPAQLYSGFTHFTCIIGIVIVSTACTFTFLLHSLAMWNNPTEYLFGLCFCFKNNNNNNNIPTTILCWYTDLCHTLKS